VNTKTIIDPLVKDNSQLIQMAKEHMANTMIIVSLIY